MEKQESSTSSSHPVKDPVTSRALYLKNFLHKRAVDLQIRQNRQSLSYIKELMKELQDIKFECLHSEGEILDLFATISKRAEICLQQLEISEEVGIQEYRKKRKRKQMRESFGFSEFKEENYSEDDIIIESSDEEPDYLKHFQMEKKRNDEIIWGTQKTQIQQDGLEVRPEFRDVKYTVLNVEEQFNDRIAMVKE